MERSSTSLLNLQNTLPLFRYAGYCCARAMPLLLPAGTATLHAGVLAPSAIARHNCMLHPGTLKS